MKTITCSKRSDSGERCEERWKVERNWEERRGNLSHLSSSIASIFSRSFLIRTAERLEQAMREAGVRVGVGWGSGVGC